MSRAYKMAFYGDSKGTPRDERPPWFVEDDATPKLARFPHIAKTETRYAFVLSGDNIYSNLISTPWWFRRRRRALCRAGMSFI